MRFVGFVFVVLWTAVGGLSAQDIFLDDFESGHVALWSGTVGVVCVDQCNLVPQTGCLPGEKCTLTVTCTNPIKGCARCAENGTVGSGGACTVDPISGIDDCGSGLFCQNGICKEFCTAFPDSCVSSDTCFGLASTFDGQEFALCSPQCDLFAQDCTLDESCYLLPDRGMTVCWLAEPEPPPPSGCGSGLPRPGIQGECCSHVHTCDSGYGCLQPDKPNFDFMVCARFCDPTGLVGFDDCAPALGPDFWCLAMNRFYSNVPNLQDYHGFCIPQSTWGPPDCYNGLQDPDEDGVDCCIEPGGNPDCPCVFECP